LTGADQTLGLLQFDGFYASDIVAYEKAAGLPQVPIQTVLLDGFDGMPTTGSSSGNPEVSLDIEMAISMAPGLSKIIVFEAGPDVLQNDILSAMASHSEVKQLSCSWGWGGGPKATTDNIFKLMAAQGQSFFSASGDSDAFPAGSVDDPSQPNAPSSCPYITVDGGTSLTTSGPGGAWVSESVWNRASGVGSRGGISSYYASRAGKPA
jgi:subtilase family serine protease